MFNILVPKMKNVKEQQLDRPNISSDNKKTMVMHIACGNTMHHRKRN